MLTFHAESGHRSSTARDYCACHASGFSLGLAFAVDHQYTEGGQGAQRREGHQCQGVTDGGIVDGTVDLDHQAATA